MNFFIDFIRQASRICGVLSAALVGLAIIVVCQMVVMRYFLGASTIWQTEFVTYSIVAATFLGSPYVLLIKGHVNVDLLPIYLGNLGKKLMGLLAAFLALAFCLCMTWYAAIFYYEALEGGWVTDTIWELPLWIPYLSMPVGLGLLSLQYVADILSILNGRELPFAKAASSHGGR